jgi:hypothetical protein
LSDDQLIKVFLPLFVHKKKPFPSSASRIIGMTKRLTSAMEAAAGQ